MSLIKGSVNISSFDLTDVRLDLNKLDAAIKTNSFTDIETVATQYACGFVSFHDYMDTSFAYADYDLNPFMVLGVRQDKRNITSAVLNKYYRMEIEQARNLQPDWRPSKADRVMLKEKAKLKLLLQTPPVPKTWECFINTRDNRLVVLSASDAEIATTLQLLERCLTFSVQPYNPLAAFSEVSGISAEHAQQYFLTWLWWLADTSIIVNAATYGDVDVSFAGRISLNPLSGKGGTTVNVLGADDNLWEARQALDQGKLVSAIKVEYIIYGDIYRLSLDAKTLQPKSVLLPSIENAENDSDTAGLTLERIFVIETLVRAHGELMAAFIAMYKDNGAMLDHFNAWKSHPHIL